MKISDSRFYFVGIGGIGMCGLAELLHSMGAKVSGSDMSDNANTEHLKNLGIQIHHDHKAGNVGDIDVMVYSSAISMNNAEIREARARQIPLIPRAEALAEIMRLKRGLAVAGTHGKTTTTSMTSAILMNAGLKPTIVVGGRFQPIKSTALLGTGEWLVAEADESDGSFHKLSPEIAIITNIDSDHLDHFKTFENLQKSFYDFALKIPFYGIVIICGDDQETRKLFAHYPKRLVFYGFNHDNDFVISGANGSYQVRWQGGSLQMSLPVPGRHNALNATASLIASHFCGVDWNLGSQSLATYQGVDRRFQFKGETRQGVLVYDDYGHHPTEVLATLQAFREKFPERRIVVSFQPHRYSRTLHSWQEFLTAFKDADVLFIADIYPAGEQPISGVTSDRLVEEMKHDCVQRVTKENALSLISETLKQGDVFVTLGAGDGWKLGMSLLAQ